MPRKKTTPRHRQVVVAKGQAMICDDLRTSVRPPMCLSTFIPDQASLRLRHFGPLQLPDHLDHQSGVQLYWKEHQYVLNGMDETDFRLPGSENEEFLNFFNKRNEDVICEAAKMGIISIDLVEENFLDVFLSPSCVFDDSVGMDYFSVPPGWKRKQHVLLKKILLILQPTVLVGEARIEGQMSSEKNLACLPSLDRLYDIVQRNTCHRRDKDAPLEDVYQPKQLLAKLRSYQAHAVRWALHRERDPEFNLDPMYCWTELMTETIDSLSRYFYNRFNGTIRKCNGDSGPQNVEEGKFCLRGGILADEMGLGKTMETMSLILLHQRPDAIRSAPAKIESWKHYPGDGTEKKDTFECVCGGACDEDTCPCNSCGALIHPKCNGGVYFERSGHQCLWCLSQSSYMFPLKCTLIVCPQSIVKQWENEVQRHIDSSIAAAYPKVYIYRGISGVRRTVNDPASHPLHFEEYDIVLTTYNVLRTELHHADIIRRRSKFEKRFPAIPSPLMSVQWWRVCLDEAQMVESSTAKAAAMALKLDTVNRWCITGTPFCRQTGMDDLYGLLLFLQVKPWGDPRWFRHGLKACYENTEAHELVSTKIATKYIASLLHAIMWRSAKKDVNVGLLPQEEVTYRLKFSATEAHFYQMQKEECNAIATKLFTNIHSTAEQIGTRELQKIAVPLLRLRQACCHPQIGSFGISPLDSHAPMPISEILQKLVDKAQDVCTDKLKIVILHMAGKAALLDIKNDFQDAIGMYTNILSLLEKEKELYKTDEFQMLHALHNLCESAERWQRINPEGARSMTLYKPILTLRSEARVLRSRLAATRHSDVLFWRRRMDLSTKRFKENEAAATDAAANGTAWWNTALTIVYSSPPLLANFNATVKGMLSSCPIHERMSWSHRAATGLGYVLEKKLEDLIAARFHVISYLQEHTAEPTPEEVRERGNCSRCSSLFDRTGTVCFHCRAEGALVDYNEHLYSYRLSSRDRRNQGVFTDEANINDRSFRSNSILCRILLNLAQVVRPSSPTLYAAAKLAMGSFDILQAELAAAQKLHAAQSQRLATLDELDVCTTRLRLRYEGETVTAADAKWKLLPIEIEPMFAEHDIEIIAARAALQEAKGQLNYLRNVEKNEAHCTGKRKRSEDETGISVPDNCCIICCENIDEKVMFQCAHVYCSSCVSKLLNGRKSGDLKCPHCRQATNIANLRKVRHQESEHESQTVTSAYSSITSEVVDIRGSYGTKIEAVLKVCKRVLKTTAESKFLIFSQWDEVLDITEKAFADNNVSFVRLKGSGKQFHERLNLFRLDPTISSLLLPIKSGANGLNLTEAQHVIIMDPLLNAAVEAQAIGRVHRIGQTRQTCVHRFVVRDTIEERIDAMKRRSRQHLKAEARLPRLTGAELHLLFE